MTKVGAKKMVPAIRFAGFDREWENHKVGDFYEFKNGLNKGKEFFGYGLPIVNFTDVYHNRRIVVAKLKGRVSLTHKEIKSFEVKQGDIFFTRTSETIIDIGYPSVMMEPSENIVFSGFVLRARALGSDPLALNFKPYVFFTKAFRKEMVQKSSMTTRALTSGTAIKNMNYVAGNCKKEQSKIGEYFHQLDMLIAGHRRKREKLLQLKKSLLEKMFPKQGQDKPEIRFVGFEGNWIKSEFAELSNIRRGLTYRPSDLSNKQGVRVLRSSNIDVDRFIERDDDVFVSKNAANIEPVKNEDILITSANGSSRLVGKHALINGVSCMTFHGGFMLLATAKSPYFLNASMSSEWYSKFLKLHIAGGNGAIGNLSKSSLERQSILSPKMKEQTKIGEMFKQMDALIDQHQSQITKLLNIKQGCLAKMFV